MKHPLLTIFALLLPFFLFACSDDDNPQRPSGDPPLEVLPPRPAGMLLPGDPDTPAVAATVWLTPSPVSTDQINGRLLTTRLAAVIAPSATVAAVNAALEAHDAAIVSMVAGTPFVHLVIPAVADQEAAQALAQSLVASGAFVHARPGQTAPRAVDADPLRQATTRGGHDRLALDFPDAGALANVPHLLPARGPAAWNLRRAATGSATLMVSEYFADLDGYSEVPQLQFGSLGGRPLTVDDGIFYTLGGIGFHTLGVAVADWTFDPVSSAHTGMDPVAADRTDVVAIHVHGLDLGEILASIAFDLSDRERAVVLSTTTFADPALDAVPAIDRAWLGLRWRQLVHVVVGHENFVHVTAAGETGADAGPFNTATLNSPYAVAAETDLTALAAIETPADQLAAFTAAYTIITAETPAVAAPLSNVLIVGSSSAAGQESSFSTPGSHVRMVGEAVAGPCLLTGQCSEPTQLVSSTSAASAQVAGLATYLWNLAPDRQASDLLLRLQHAYTAGSQPGLLDAAIAVLSLDRSLADAPLRLSLLDVSGPDGLPDQQFTEHDLEAFLAAFDAFEGATTPDWSLYDLNGDGWTGGSGGARLDLDVNDLPGFSTITQDIDGTAVEFDETAVTDEQVLCYYAWSDLYTGDPAQRSQLLPCGSFEVQRISVTGHVSAVAQVAAIGKDADKNYDEDEQSASDVPEASLPVLVSAQGELPGIGSGTAYCDASLDWTEIGNGSVQRLLAHVELNSIVSLTQEDPPDGEQMASGVSATTDLDYVFRVTDTPVQLTLTGSGGGEAVITRLDLIRLPAALMYSVNETELVVPIEFTAELEPGDYRLHVRPSLSQGLIGDAPGTQDASGGGTLELTLEFTADPPPLARR